MNYLFKDYGTQIIRLIKSTEYQLSLSHINYFNITIAILFLDQSAPRLLQFLNLS